MTIEWEVPTSLIQQMAAVLSDKTFMCALSKISDLEKVFKAKI